MPKMIRIPARSEKAADALLSDGWREIETLETWSAVLHDGLGIRRAAAGDMPAVEKIARQVFKHDRLHSDPAVDDAEADKFKAGLVRSAFAWPHKTVYVHGKPIDGFLIVRFPDGDMVIDLIGVKEESRGQDIARRLIQGARTLAGPHAITAGTQSTNEAAKRLYQSIGMKIVKRERTFHK